MDERILRGMLSGVSYTVRSMRSCPSFQVNVIRFANLVRQTLQMLDTWFNLMQTKERVIKDVVAFVNLHPDMRVSIQAISELKLALRI